MVTFVCHHCDVTLKKKQLEKHSFQCRRPAKFICIDCSNTFIGEDYKKHIACMTEQEKYHGQYAKKTKQQLQQAKQAQQAQQQKAAPAPVEEQKEDVKATTAKKQVEEVEEEEQQTKTNWPGWKKTIRKIIKQKANKQIKLRKLKELACKKYNECYPEEEMKDIEQVFDEKLAANSKFQVINEPYVKL